MTFDDFRAQAESVGLQAKQCSSHHWQLIGGRKHRLVNIWPNSKRGIRMQVNHESARGGRMIDAFLLAGPDVTTPPRDKAPKRPPRPDRVGLIRWLWRLIWSRRRV